MQCSCGIARSNTHASCGALCSPFLLSMGTCSSGNRYTCVFKKGSKFTWTLPALVRVDQDGQIVDDPRGDETTLTCEGTKLTYTWLAYAPGRTTVTKVDGDVLTGPMSGCIIAKWEDARHARCVGHVGTVDGNARTNELVKTTFDRNMPANTTGVRRVRRIRVPVPPGAPGT